MDESPQTPGDEIPSLPLHHPAKEQLKDEQATRTVTATDQLIGAESHFASTLDLIGPYRKLELIGQGGQGEVWLTEDTRLCRRVALKLLLQPTPEHLRRFQREAEITSRLDHPGICTIYESGAIDGQFFIAMRYIEGESLAQLLAAQQSASQSLLPTHSEKIPHGPTLRADIARAVQLLVITARALHTAHEAGVVHRDIKPANIIISKQGQPVIVDFGIARDNASGLNEATRSREFGTPAYISPEQLCGGSGARVDRRTDVWSLGVILYQCLTWCRPFGGPTLEATYRAILNNEPRAVRNLNPAIPKDLAVIVETALTKDITLRYQTAEDLANDLEAFIQVRPIAARPVSVVGRVLRWSKREPAKALATATGMLVVLVGIAALVAGREAHAESEKRLIADRALETRLRSERSAALSRGLFDLRGERIGFSDEPHADKDELVRNYLDHFRQFGLRLAGEVSDEVLVENIHTLCDTPETTRCLLDGLSTFALLLEDIQDEHRLAAARYHGLFVRTNAVLDRAEPNPWRRHAWNAHLAWTYAKDDRFDTICAPDVIDSCSADDLSWLVPLIALTRGQAACLPLLQRAVELDPGNFWSQLQLAVYAATHGNTEQAIRHAEIAAALQPAAACSHRTLGLLLDRKGDHAVAIRQYRAVLATQPNSLRIRVALIEALADEKRYDEALVEAEAGLVLQPQEVRLIHKRGTIYDRRGDGSRARADYDRAIAIDPHYPYTYLSRGVSLMRGGRMDAGKTDIETAVTLGPTHGPSHNTHALLLIEVGDLEGALTAVLKAIKIDPNSAPFWTTRSWVHFRRREYAEAVNAGLRAAKLDTRLTQPLINAGLAERKLGRPEKALELFGEVIEREPKHAFAHASRGELLVALDRNDEALSALERAVELDSRSSTALHALAHCYAMKGLEVRSLQRATQSLRLFEDQVYRAPTDAEARANLACVRAMVGDVDGGISEYQRAIDIAPLLPNSYLALAGLLRDKGCTDDAIAVYDQLLAIDPSSAETWCNRGWRFVEKGDFPAALASLHQGHQLGTRSALWTYPTANWIAEVERLNANVELLSGRIQPQSTDDYVWLALGWMRQRRFSAAVRAFEHVEFELRSQAVLDDVSLRTGYSSWMVLQRAAEAASALYVAGPPGEAETLRYGELAIDWLARGLVQYRADAASQTARVEKTSLLLDLKQIQNSDSLRAVLHPPVEVNWSAQARDIVTEISVLRALWSQP